MRKNQHIATAKRIGNTTKSEIMTLKSFQGLCGSGVAKFSRFALAHLVIPLPFHNMQQNGCCMGLKYLHEKLGEKL